jgi:hypothetical protein
MQLNVHSLLQVLVEGPSKRDANSFTGRTDTMKRVVFPNVPMAAAYGNSDSDRAAEASLLHVQPGYYVAVEVRNCWRHCQHLPVIGENYPKRSCSCPAMAVQNPQPQTTYCRYIAASLTCPCFCRQVVAASAGTLTGVPLGRTSLRAFVNMHGSAAPLQTAATVTDESLQQLCAVG